ncbi:hypothetical protein [Embleya sp. NPDC020630]|uniref:hypothetical protein n=1 Tax=Embleya sp. NPDC020630 TaxID=3363979 RepID=UPI0037B8F4B9
MILLRFAPSGAKAREALPLRGTEGSGSAALHRLRSGLRLRCAPPLPGRARGEGGARFVEAPE